MPFVYCSCLSCNQSTCIEISLMLQYNFSHFLFKTGQLCKLQLVLCKSQFNASDISCFYIVPAYLYFSVTIQCYFKCYKLVIIISISLLQLPIVMCLFPFLQQSLVLLNDDPPTLFHESPPRFGLWMAFLSEDHFPPAYC